VVHAVLKGGHYAPTDYPPAVQELLHALGIERQVDGALVGVQAEDVHLGVHQQRPVGVAAAVHPPHYIDRPEEGVEALRHLVVAEGEDGGTEGGEIRLIQIEDDPRRKLPQPPRLPPRRHDEVLLQDVAQYLVIDDGLAILVGDGHAEGEGSGQVPLDRVDVGGEVLALLQQGIKPLGIHAVHGKEGGVIAHVVLVEVLHLLVKAAQGIHPEAVVADGGAGHVLAEHEDHVLVEAAAGELRPEGYLAEAADDISGGGKRVVVGERADARRPAMCGQLVRHRASNGCWGIILCVGGDMRYCEPK